MENKKQPNKQLNLSDSIFKFKVNNKFNNKISISYNKKSNKNLEMIFTREEILIVLLRGFWALITRFWSNRSTRVGVSSYSRIMIYITVCLAVFCDPITAFKPTPPSLLPTPTSPTASPSSRSDLNYIKTIAGYDVVDSAGTGGLATAMSLNYPVYTFMNSNSIFYIVESNGHCVRMFAYPNGIVSNFAGICGSYNYGGDNGPASAALLLNPTGFGMNTAGVAYICDQNNNAIRMVSTSLIITTFVGNGDATDTGDGGAATAATIYAPYALWIDSLGQLFVTTYTSGFIRKINLLSIISTIAGQYLK